MQLIVTKNHLLEAIIKEICEFLVKNHGANNLFGIKLYGKFNLIYKQI